MIIVTALVQNFGFGTLDSYLGLRLQTQDFRLRTWDSGLLIINLAAAGNYCYLNTSDLLLTECSIPQKICPMSK